MPVPQTATERLTEIEVQLLHLQRYAEQLDSVVTELGLRVDRQNRVIELLENQVKDLQAKPQDAPSDPLDEKPPHY